MEDSYRKIFSDELGRKESGNVNNEKSGVNRGGQPRDGRRPRKCSAGYSSRLLVGLYFFYVYKRHYHSFTYCMFYLSLKI